MKKNIWLLLICFFTGYLKPVHATDAPAQTFLVFGGETGWIGQKMVKFLKEQGRYVVVCSRSRLENRESIVQEVTNVRPNFIINCAGVTGTPNVDWCEDHKAETIRTNIIGTLNLIDIAYSYNIPVTNFGTGCIYEYDVEHPIGSGKLFSETDPPNFTGSFYSKTKVLLEQLMNCYPNVLNLRLRMPISSDMHPKNFITKITRYKKVVNVPNSMSILDDLLPAALDMTLQGVKGNINFVNPGTLSHNEILDLYIQYIDPMFRYENFTVEEQNQILKAKRSNNELDASRLLQFCPYVPHIKDSIHKVFLHMKQNG